jgi:hypothetical protein
MACHNAFRERLLQIINRVALMQRAERRCDSKRAVACSSDGVAHRAIRLRENAPALGLGEGRVTYTVLESPDPAGALLDYARQAQVDHIVIGARGASAVRRYLGSVSSQVVAEASCNVTVVRTRAAESLP